MDDAEQLALKLRGFAKEVADLADHVASLEQATPRALANQIAALVMTPLPLCPARLTPADVINATAAVMKLPVGQLLSKNRTQRVAFVRQIAMYLCRELTNASFPAIGVEIGRDHSTVIHAHNLIGMRLKMVDSGSLGIHFVMDAVQALLDQQGISRRAQIESLRQTAA